MREREREGGGKKEKDANSCCSGSERVCDAGGKLKEGIEGKREREATTRGWRAGGKEGSINQGAAC